MNLTNIKTAMMKTSSNIKVFGMKYSPEILVVACIGTAIGAVATAIVATRKVDEVIEEHNTGIEECEKALNGEVELINDETYTEEDYKSDVRITYVRTGLKFIKLYAPTVILTGLSIASVLGSHRIMTKRNTGLVAALAASDKAFKEYRKRVIEELGEEMDTHFRLGTKAAQIQQTVTDEKGNEKTVTEDVTLADEINPLTDTRRYFDKYSTPAAFNSPDYDMFYLNSQEAAFTNKLTACGKVWLNDVLHALGYDEVALGQTVGWLYDPENPDHDNFVSFKRKKIKRFIEGEWIDSYILDFNHDGEILSKIWNKDVKKRNLDLVVEV